MSAHTFSYWVRYLHGESCVEELDLAPLRKNVYFIFSVIMKIQSRKYKLCRCSIHPCTGREITTNCLRNSAVTHWRQETLNPRHSFRQQHDLLRIRPYLTVTFSSTAEQCHL